MSWPAAAALVAGNMIGTGVFTSLGFQVIDYPGGFSIAVLWVLGGVVALCGAASYAELGSMFPRSGGEYHLLAKSWHPLAGFLAGWLSMTVGFAAPVALACTAFGEYAGNALSGGGAGARTVGALSLLAVATAVHLASIQASGRIQVVLTSLKLAVLAGLAAAGWASASAPGFSLAPTPGEISRLGHPAFAVSLFFVAYSYSGWNAAIYIVGEIRRPERHLPKALLVGTGLVTLLYVAFNLALLRATPVDQLRGQLDVGLVAARHMFGDFGGRVMGGLIAVGLISAVSAMMWAGPRVAATMGRDWRLFSLLAKTNRSGVPWVATLWQAAIAAGLILAGSFQTILTYTEFTLSLSAFLTVAGVFWLRLKAPDHPRPYRCSGYPVTPALFLLATGYALVRFASHPDQWLKSWIGLATIASGAAVYAVAKHLSNAAKGTGA
ncbi:MAG: APC family permease [Verrucomicrobiales bacterium]